MTKERLRLVWYTTMVKNFHYTKSDISKLGNAIVFLAKNVPDPNKTKLLKLVYFLQEKSIQKYGIPFFKIPFKVWQFGPVNPDLYQEFNGRPFILEEYISTSRSNDTISIIPKSDFNDEEFSDREIDLMEKIVLAFKNTPASELVELTHYEGNPWHRTACEHNLISEFQNKMRSTTDIDIDFTGLIENDPDKIHRYESYLEYMDSSSALKN